MSDMFGAAIPTVLGGAVGLTASTAKTVIQIQSPTGHRVKILGWGVFFDGANAATNPARCRLMRQTTAGTMTSGAPTKVATRAESLLTTMTHTATAEPTAGDVIEIVTCHPQQGYEVKFPPGQEPTMGGGERVGIEVFVAAGVNCFPKIFFEE